MHDTSAVSTILIVVAVLLFFFLGIAIMVIMDHKARLLPSSFAHNPFSIVGKHRDHPMIAFLTTLILFGIIASLLLVLLATAAEHLGLAKEHEPGGLLARLKAERTVERVRHFHHYPARMYATEGKKNVCFLCHGDYPHSKEPMVRTLLNMHTQFVGCMTCHADARKVPEDSLELRWLNYSGIAVKGRPYGTDIDPKTGSLAETDDYYSRIVAFAKHDKDKTPIEITADDPRMQEFAKVRDRLSDADRDAVKKTFHKLVSPKGRFCSRCHTDEGRGFVPFRALGFSERRVRDLTNLNLIGLVEKYREFYLPTLMRSEKSLPSLETLTGPRPAKPAASGPDMRQDPRSWWKGKYDAPRPAPPESP